MKLILRHGETALNFSCKTQVCLTYRDPEGFFKGAPSPASDITMPLGSQALPAVYINVIDSAYGTMKDGDELFAKFLNTMQNAGEKPYMYCQHLQVALSKAVRGDTISAVKADQLLLRQFCCGCWDNMLMSELQLEQKKKNLPTFSDLLLQ